MMKYITYTKISIFSFLKVKHRLTNKGDQTLIVIETWHGDNLDENDIQRYEDIYNRDFNDY